MNEDKLDKIIQSIQSIEKRLDVIENNTLKMDRHINFVEKTYNVVRLPLSWLKSKVEYVAGSPKYEELPQIENVEK
jgi:archaellum component FlaC